MSVTTLCGDLSEPHGYSSYEIYVWTPKPQNRGATGHGASNSSWSGLVAYLERELAAGQELIQIQGHRANGDKDVLLDTRIELDPLCLLRPLASVRPGHRQRPSGLAERQAA